MLSTDISVGTEVFKVEEATLFEIAESEASVDCRELP